VYDAVSFVGVSVKSERSQISTTATLVDSNDALWFSVKKARLDESWVLAVIK
jgi:hypothetical protein